MQNQIQLLKVITFIALMTLAAPALRADDTKGLPSHGRLQTALKNVVAGGNNGGGRPHTWGAVVQRAAGGLVLWRFGGENRGPLVSRPPTSPPKSEKAKDIRAAG